VLMTTATATLSRLQKDEQGQVWDALLEACGNKPERLMLKILRVSLYDVEGAVNALDRGDIKAVKPEVLKAAAAIFTDHHKKGA
jgi:hypothetical protein